MIHLSTGLPRNGKTLFTIAWVKDLSERENRPVFYSGIAGVTLPWTEINAEEWYNCPPGSIILIDEAQRHFRPRGNGSKVPRFVEELETHGHEGLDIFIITQHPMLIESNVRRLTEVHWHVSRPDGADKATVLRFKGCKEQPLSKLADAERMEWPYPVELYGCYESAKIHTVKKRVSMHRVLMWTLPLVAVAFIGLFVWRQFNKMEAPVEAKAETPSFMSRVGHSPGREADKPKPMTQAEYLAAYNPRIDGLAYTAPIYDEVTKPVRAPVPTGAVIFKGKCQAYSQQATKLNMPDAICRQIAAHGFFREFDDRPERNDLQRVQTVKPAPNMQAAAPTQPQEAVQPYRYGSQVEDLPGGSHNFAGGLSAAPVKQANKQPAS